MKIWKRVTAAFLALTMLATTARDFPLSPIAQAAPAATADDDADWYTTNKGNRLFWRYDQSPFGGVISTNQVHVYAKAGETICFGTNVYDAKWNLAGTSSSGLKENQANATTNMNYSGLISEGDLNTIPADIVLIDLKGNRYGYNVINNTNVDGTNKNAPGLIATPADETSAKTMVSPEGSGKYVPFTYTATEDGVYTFEFRTGTGATESSSTVGNKDNNRNRAKDSQWDQSLQQEVSAWDISVFSETNERITGRVYMDFIAIQSVGTLKEQFYILTNDNYIYRLRFNGVQPYTCTLFANNRGVMDSATGNIVYKSAKYFINDLNSYSELGIEYKKPSSLDTDLSKTFKIFFEKPNADLQGILYDKAILPQPAKNVQFLSANGDSSGDIYSGSGGYFSFEVTEATTATLRIEFTKEGETIPPAEISDVVTPYSTPVFYWDGCDGNGKPVPEGTKISYSVTTKAGEIHLPIVDMESAPNGITMTRINDIYENDTAETPVNNTSNSNNIYDATKSVVYYDETAIYYGEKVASTGLPESEIRTKYSTFSKKNYISALEAYLNVPDHAGETELTVDPTKLGDADTNNFFSSRLTFGTLDGITIDDGKSHKYSTQFNNLSSNENTLFTNYASKHNVRVGDHSHTSNIIDYSKPANEQVEGLIDYLNSEKNPVGKSTGGLTTTDYAIANYWAFVPATSSAKETKNISEYKSSDILGFDGVTDIKSFNLRAFTFFDEKINNSNNGIYSPQADGDHALADAVFNVYRKIDKQISDSGEITYYYKDGDTIISTTNYSDASSGGRDVYILESTAVSTITGDYIFPALPYDSSKGTKYMLQVVPPDPNFKLTSGTQSNQNPPKITLNTTANYNFQNAYSLYAVTKTNGTAIQEFTVGGSGITPTADNKNTVTITDVGYHFERFIDRNGNEVTVRVSKTWNVKNAETRPDYVALELSYTTVGIDTSTLYSYHNISLMEQSAYSYTYLPEYINDPNNLATKNTVDDYYVSAEYYFLDGYIYKHTYAYDALSTKYTSLQGVGSCYKVTVEGKSEPTIDDIKNEDGTISWAELTSGESGTYAKGNITVTLESTKSAPYVSTISRTFGSAETTIAVTNSDNKGVISITKVDNDCIETDGTISSEITPEQYLSGANFRLYALSIKNDIRGDDDAIATVRKKVEAASSGDPDAITWLNEHQAGSASTGINGQLTFPGLSPDTDTQYVVRERFAAPGYVILQEYFLVEYKDFKKISTEGDDSQVASLVIGNAKAQDNFVLRKRISGRAWTDDDTFTFKISDVNVTADANASNSGPFKSTIDDKTAETNFKTALEDNTVTISSDTDFYGDTWDTKALISDLSTNSGLKGWGLSNSEFPFPGTYTFKVKEKAPSDEKFKYSTAEYEVTIDVTVDDDVAGDSSMTYEEAKKHLVPKVSRIENTSSHNLSTDLLFVNTYTIKEFDVGTKYNIIKQFTGRPGNRWEDTDKFYFTISGFDESTSNAIENGSIKLEFKDNNNETVEPTNIDDKNKYIIEVDNKSNYLLKSTSGINQYGFHISEIDFSNVSFTPAVGGATDQTVKYYFKIEETDADGTPKTAPESGITYATNSYILQAELFFDEDHIGEHAIQKTEFTVFDGNGFEIGGESNKQLGGTCTVYNPDDTPKAGEDVHGGLHDFTFENTYSASVDWTLSVKKTIEGREWETSDKFTFDLTVTPTAGVTLPESKSITIEKDNDSTPFGTIKFTKPGTYTFTITETISGKGINEYGFEPQTEYLYIRAVDNKDGTMSLYQRSSFSDTSGTLISDNKTEVAFTNIYSESGEIKLFAEDIIKGRKWAESDSFDILIKPDDVAKKAIEDRKITGLSSADTDGNYTVKLNYTTDSYTGEERADEHYYDSDTNKIVKLLSTLTFSAEGNYKFTVSEKAGTIKDLDYDKTSYEITVNVEREIDDILKIPTGKLIVNAVYTTTSPHSGPDPVNLPFTNQAYTDVTLNLNKELLGRNWADDETFTAEISCDETDKLSNIYIVEADGTVTPFTDKTEVQIPEEEGTFVKFRFYNTDTYTFTIKETNESTAELICDSTEYTWTVAISDTDKDGTPTGKMTADTTLTDNKGTLSFADNNTITFTNTYSKSIDGITVSKDFTGRADDEWFETDKFYFKVTADADMQKAITAGNLSFVDDKGEKVDLNEKAYTFDSKTKEITLPTAVFKDIFKGVTGTTKTFTFTITEVDADGNPITSPKNGITYDTSSYTLTYTVTEKADKTYEVTKSENITITNTYKADPVSATLSIKKELDGRAWDSDTFTFKITPSDTSAPTTADVTITDTNKTGNFTLTFDKTGTYTYTISEEKGEKGGVTYTDETHKVEFTVEDNDNGNLVITSIKIDGTDITLTGGKLSGNTNTVNTSDALTFTNTYSAGSKSNQSKDLYWIWVEKSIDGREWLENEQYRFNIETGDTATTEAYTNGQIKFISGSDGNPGEDRSNVYVDNSDDIGRLYGAADKHADSFRIYFEGLKFSSKTETKTFTFKITEDASSATNGGIKADKTIYLVTLEVGDKDYDGVIDIISEKVTKDGENFKFEKSADTKDEHSSIVLPFVNHYDPNGTWTFNVSETLNGRPWKLGDEFTYQLSLTNVQDDYSNGVTKANATFPETITVKDGEISTAAEGAPKSTTCEVKFTKGGTYTFTLTQTKFKDNDFPYNGVSKAETSTYKIVVQVKDDNHGTLTPTVVEINGETVTDGDSTFNFINTYTATVDWILTVEKTLTGRPWQDLDNFKFTLAKATDTDDHVRLPDTATLDITDKSDSVSDTAKENSFSAVMFTSNGDISTAGTNYTLTLTETKVANNGITYAEPYTITVNVVDDGDGTLTATVTNVTEGEETADYSNGENAATIKVTNSYSATGTLAENSIKVNKKIDGRSWWEEDTFTFDLEPFAVNGKTISAADYEQYFGDTKFPLTVTADKENKTVGFGAINFKSFNGEKENIYTFKVTEQNPPAGFTNVHVLTVITVRVTDNYDGTLTAEIMEDKTPVARKTLNITNTYKATGTLEDKINVSKTITGRPWQDFDSFDFILTLDKVTLSDDTDKGKEETVTVKVGESVELTKGNSTSLNIEKGTDESQTYSSSFDKLTFSKPGEYVFTVSEIRPAPESKVFLGLTYSNITYTITVTVTDNYDGTLTAETTDSLNCSFENIYSASADLPDDTIVVHKVLSGRDWLTAENESYKFKVEQVEQLSDGTYAPTEYDSVEMSDPAVVTVSGEDNGEDCSTDLTKDNKIIFKSNGNAENIYLFRITELSDDPYAGVTYSTDSQIVTVTVNDDFQGNLTVTVANGVHTFENTYQATGSLSANSIQIVKELKERDWLKGILKDYFNFTIQPYTDDETTAKAVNKGNILFPTDAAVTITSDSPNYSGNESQKTESYSKEIHFVSNGQETTQYKFKVTEDTAIYYSIREDSSTFIVTVEVTDDFKGDLTAKVVSTAVLDEDNKEQPVDVIMFSNLYTAEGTWPPVVNKILEGRPWLDTDEFKFTLTLDETASDYKDVEFENGDNTVTITSKDFDSKKKLYTKQFNTVIFHRPGDYYFTVKEETPDPAKMNGIKYSPAYYYMYVKVMDNRFGTLFPIVVSAKPYNADGEEITEAIDGNTDIKDNFPFLNTYSATAALDKIEVSKKLTGRDWLKKGDTTGETVLTEDESYKFSITAADEYTSAAVNRKDIILPADISISGTSDSEIYKALFDGIIFNSNGNRTNTYTFEISEKIPADNEQLGGIEYDDNVYTVKVTVTDDFNGTLTLDAEIPENILFTNIYKSTGTIEKGTINVSKTLTGRPWLTDDKFEFSITVKEQPEGSNVDLPDDLIISKGAGIGNTFTGTFDDITFDEPGEYEFEIKEIRNGENNGIIYDTDTVYTVYVTVKDNFDGTLTVTDITGNENISFTNKYSASVSTSAISFINKVDGRPWLKDEQFSFSLEAADDVTQNAVDNKLIILPVNADITLTGDGENNQMSADFGAIEFRPDGKQETTYTFKAHEVIPDEKLGGLKYSEKEYIITVTVTDDFNGNLSINITGIDNIEFVNTYTANGSLSENSISATKVLTGREWLGIEGVFTDSFTFVLEPDLDNADTADAFRNGLIKLNGDKVTVTDETDGHKDYFGSIDFKSNGQKTTVYIFKLSEVIPEGYEKEYSIDYDKNVFNVKVEVTDNYDGTLSTKIIGSADAEFTNKYTASGVWPPVVNKVIDGREWLSDDRFTFKIALDKEYSDDYPVVITQDTLMIGKDDLDETTGLYTKQFEDIIFSKPGNYFFTVSEVKGQAGGLTYSDTEYYMYVRVVDEENKGTLVPYVYFAIPQNSVSVITGDEVEIEKALTFVNAYSATAALDKIEISKKLTGRDWLKKGDTTGETVLSEDESYKFTITAADEYTSAAVNRNNIILPADISISGTSDGEIYKALFDGIIFNSNGNPTNDYAFEIREKIPADNEQLGGVVYDKSVYTVNVTVTDDFNGTLTLNAEIPENILFTNIYKSTGAIEKGTINVSKTLTGRPWQTDDKFEFEIKNTVKPANSTVTIADKGKLVIEKGTDISDTFTGAFGEITFDEPGEYEFEIREINDGKSNGIDYDGTVYTVKVSVYDNYDGTLTAVVTGADSISFTNRYHAETTATEINFTKKVTGRHWEKGETFAFKLETADTLTQQAIDSGLVILPDNAETTLTGDGIKDEMTSAFGAIKFNSDGKSETTYKFKITEEKGTRGGLTYDETVYTVTAVVKDDFKGNLTVELSGAENIVFTNTYAATGSLADNAISVSKVLTGREWLDNDLVKDSFTFVIEPYGDTVNAVGTTVFMPENAEITVADKNDPKAFFEKIDFKSDGERTARYKFKVTEQNTQASGIDYDNSAYIITVTVSDDYNGALTAEVTDISKDGEPAESIVFTNDYSAYGIWPPVADKVIDGRKWLDSDSFTFKIALTYEEVENSVNMPDDNTVDVTVSNNKDGKYAAQFDDITFTKPGMYVFEVSEEKGEISGLTYDTTVYEMYVDVSDDGMGKLTPKVVRVLDQQGDDFDYGHINSLTFTNKYNAVGTLETGGITVSKLLDGREWLDNDSFKFTITPAEDHGSNVEIADNSITISGTDSAKTASFGNITFRKAGTYSFNISETRGDIPNITYDTSVYTVTVEATDNYDGTLTVKVTGSSAFTFTNTFVPDETSSEETAPPSEESTTAPEEITSDETTTPPEETTISEETTTPPEETTISEETTTPPEETTISEETTTPPEETTSPEEITTSPEETTAPSSVTTTDNNKVDGEDDENNKPDDNVNTGTPLDAGAFAATSVLLAALIPTLNRRKTKNRK